jgi:hypothetical protein
MIAPSMSLYERGPQTGSGRVHFLQKWIAALVIAASALITSQDAVQAQARGDDTELSFDIPAQSLETALEAFGGRSRLQVLYETALTAGRRSNDVNGIFTRSAALRQLLSGTGLAFTYTEDRAFTLVPIRTAAQLGLDGLQMVQHDGGSPDHCWREAAYFAARPAVTSGSSSICRTSLKRLKNTHRVMRRVSWTICASVKCTQPARSHPFGLSYSSEFDMADCHFVLRA